MSAPSKITYVIADPLLSWSLVGNVITTQVPACDYGVDLVQSGEPSTFVNVTIGSTLVYSAFSRDLVEACNKTINVTATLINYTPPLGQI